MIYVKIKLKYLTKANANALIIALKAKNQANSLRLRLQITYQSGHLHSTTIIIEEHNLNNFKHWLEQYLEPEVFIIALVIT